MPLFEVELSDGRVIELEADAAPSESDVLSALDSYQPPKATAEQLTTEKKQAQRFGRLAEADVAAGKALESVGQFFANIPANILNIPQAISKATGLEKMETPFRFQAGQPVLPELLPQPNDLTKKIEAIAGTTRGGTGIPDANAQLLAGLLKGGEDLGRGLTTPEVLMTAGAGVAPGAIRTAVPTVFAEQMIAHTPEAYQEFGRASVEGSPAEAIRAGVGAVGSSAMIGTIAAHGVRGSFPERPPRNLEADALEAELGGTPTHRETLLLPERTGPIITPPPEPPPTLRETLSRSEEIFRELNRRREAALAESDPVALSETQKRITPLADSLKESGYDVQRWEIPGLEPHLQITGIIHADGQRSGTVYVPESATLEQAQKIIAAKQRQFSGEQGTAPAQPAVTATKPVAGEQAPVSPAWKLTPDEAVKLKTDRGDYYRAVTDAFREGKITEQEYLSKSENDANKWPKVSVGDDVWVPQWNAAGKVTDIGYGWVDVVDSVGRIGKQSARSIDSLESHNKRHSDNLDTPVKPISPPTGHPREVARAAEASDTGVGEIPSNREARVTEPPTPQSESPAGALPEKSVTPEVTQASGAKAPVTIVEKAEAWADQVISESKSATESGVQPLGSGLGIDPNLLAAYSVKGAVKIAKGVKDFAVWSAEMVKEFGEAIKPQLEALWSRANAIVEGRDPIALSQRGMKMIADEGMPEAVRDRINPAYRVLTDKEATDAAKSIVGAADPIEAANQWASGGYADYAGKVQTAIGIELNRKLSATEQSLRKQGKTKEADAVVETQLALAQKDIQNATNAGQTVQSFSMNYANWTPAAWLKHYLDTVGKVTSLRMKRATGRDVPADPAATGKAAAEAVATDIGKTHPKVGEAINRVYGRGEDTMQGHLEKTGTPKSKSKAAAKKVEDFYQKEIKKWKKRHNIPEFDKETEAWLVREANRISQMPEGSVQRRVAGQNLFNAIARKTGFKWWELGMDFWYASALSGPTTHVANIRGNSWQMGGETGIQMLRNPTAIPQIIESFGRALPKSARGAWNILRTGHDYTGRHGSKFESPGVMELISNPTARAITLPWRFVLRGLKAADIAFFYPLQESRGVVLARAANRDIPLYGGGRAKKARELMAWNREQRAAAEQQARLEAVPDKLFQQRVDEILESKRPPELQENAQEFAFHGTFNNDMYGVAGAVGESLNSFFNKVPLAKPFVMPFVRIPVNIFNSSLNWTPVGAYRAGRAQGHKLLIGREDNTGKLYGKEVKDPLAIGDLYAKSMVGTLGFTGLAAAAGQYLFDENPPFAINGSGPASFDQKKQLRAAGWIPHSIKLGDKYHSYQDTPAAIPLAIIGEYYDAVKYRKMDQADSLDRALVALATSKSVVLDSSWLQGLSAIFGRGSEINVKHPGKGLFQQTVRTGSKFFIPNALNQIDRYFDPTVYKQSDIQGILMREMPFARKNLAPDLNVLGDPVSAPLSKRFSSVEETGSLIQMLSSRRLWPSVPLDGEMSVDEHYALIATRGPLLKTGIMENLADLMTLPRAEAQDLLSQISEASTRDAKQQLGLQSAERERKQLRRLNTR